MGKPMDRSGRVFMKQGLFDEAFPSLKDAIVEYTGLDRGIKKRSGTFYIRGQGGLMACGNHWCQRGGYEFDLEIHKMVEEHANERVINLNCGGDEGSPKGRRIGRRCTMSVQAKIILKYKEEASPSALSRASDL